MIQENKELLFKDLCARLPYKVKASYYGSEEECETWDEIEGISSDGYVDIGQYGLPIESVKPYLFPFSSMTEEQRKELFYISGIHIIYGKFYTNDEFTLEETLSGINWLLKNHFDINGLIPKGLAIDATGLNIY
jgi:hypothetical protein